MRQDTIDAVEKMDGFVVDTDAMIAYADKKAAGFGRLAELVEMSGNKSEDDKAIEAASYRYEQRHMQAIADRLRLVRRMVETLRPE